MKRTALISLIVALLCLSISLLPAEGQEPGLKLPEATRTAVEQYLKQNERIYPLAKIRLDSGGWVEIVSLVPNTMKDLAVHDVLADWNDTIVSREKYLFPIIPVRNDGRLDLDNLELCIKQASLLARANPRIIAPTSPFQLTAEDAKKIEQTYQAFYFYHIYDDAQLGYIDALEGMLTNSSFGYYGTQKDFLPKLLKVTALTVDAFWEADGLVVAKANDVWNAAYNMARQTAASHAEAMELADYSSRFYDRLWFIQAKHRKLGTAIGIGISQGSAVLERVIGALMPVVFLDGADRDLANIRAFLPDTHEGRLLRNAIDRLLPRIRGEVDVFADKLVQSLTSGEFMVDMATPVLIFLAKVVTTKAAAAWGVPIIGKALFALDVGFFLGNLLSNNPAISKEIESAKYDKDIEAVFHQVAYGYHYRKLQDQIQSGEVNAKDIEAFESAVYLTFLTESYYWQKLANGLNSTTQVKDAFDSFVRGATGPEVAKTLLPLAKQPANAAEKWRKPTVVKDLMRVTLDRLQAQQKAAMSTAFISTVLILDVSGSMGDRWQGGVKIDSMQEAAGRIITMLDAENNLGYVEHKIGGVSFEDTASIISPLKKDFQDVSREIMQLSPTNRTNIGDALIKGIELLKPEDAKVNKIMVLLTDGQNNQGYKNEEIIQGPVREAAGKGIRVFTIGFGDSGTIDEGFLKEIAKATGAQYFYALNASKLDNVYIAIGHKTGGSVLNSYTGEVAQGETVVAGSFNVPANSPELRVTLNWPGSWLDLLLKDPQGTDVQKGYPGFQLFKQAKPVYAVVSSPLAGTWIASVKGVDVPQGKTSFEVIGSLRTPYVPMARGGGTPPKERIDWAYYLLFCLIVACLGLAIAIVIVLRQKRPDLFVRRRRKK